MSKLTDRVLPALNWCHPFHWCPTDSWLRAEKYGRHNEAVQAYLATITFVDDCIGVLLDGLRCSRLRGRLRVLFGGDRLGFVLKLEFAGCHVTQR